MRSHSPDPRRAPALPPWRWKGAALVALLALAACGQGGAPELQPGADGWHEFQGSWSASGTRKVIPLGDERRASVIALRGALVLAGPQRPGIGFRADVVAMGDSATGLVGRAVWTDEKGDQVYSELRGEGTAARNRIEGTFLGGTGRYAGATGSYEFSWQYVIESEDGTIQGRAIGLKGRVSVMAPRAEGKRQ
jgi:hypothetical protein